MTVSRARLEEFYAKHLERCRALRHMPVKPGTLRALGLLVDTAGDLQRDDGLDLAVSWCEQLENQSLPSGQQALVHYFRANAHHLLRQVSGAGSRPGAWDDPHLAREINHNRWALRLWPASDWDHQRVYQMHTNLANAMNGCGRVFEAIEEFDRVLGRNPGFGMAHGNRGIALLKLARESEDEGHQALLIRGGYKSIKQALEYSETLEGEAASGFAQMREHWERHAGREWLDHEEAFAFDVTDRSLGEQAYRRWAFKHRLFLNDLNDLNLWPVAATDVAHLPSMTVPLGEGPRWLGLFNQMKQEFVSGRFLLYRGVTRQKAHYSNRDVTLVNTLDYPAYGLATEELKAAYRIAYSLLDKTAFFLNEYLALGIGADHVSFRTVWHEAFGKKQRRLRPRLQLLDNWGLQALYWLSRDVFEAGSPPAEALLPEAQELSEVRNRLEHRYLKLHQGEWAPPNPDKALNHLVPQDDLAYSLYRRSFEQKTLELYGRVRAAMLYLVLAVGMEEFRREQGRPEGQRIGGMPVSPWHDDWKQ